MLRIRLTITAFVALAALLVAGCGGSSSDGGSGSSSDSGLADLASPGSVVFAEARLLPKGELKANTDSVARALGTGMGLREFIVTELQESDPNIDFDVEVEPWIGKEGGVSFERFEGGELSEPLIVLQTQNTESAETFIKKQAAKSKKPWKSASYEDVDFKVGGSEGRAMGLIDDAFVLAHTEKEFKAAVDASQGESLGGEDRFQQTMEAAVSNGSLADVYIDLGGLVKQTEGETDVPTKETLQAAGIDPSEATAVASVIPHSNQVEVQISSELGGEKAPSGNASKLLGSLPASSFAALSFADFNEQLEEAIDSLDEEGIPPDLKPGELKSAMSQAGVDLDKIVATLDEAAVFAEGSNEASLGGAMVVTAKSGEAAEAVGSVGTLLRAASVPGITALSGKASGFSIRSSALGAKPLVVIGKGDRIAIGYGLPQATAGLNAGSGPTLSGTAPYKAAVAALGKTPISGFVDGPAALKLAEALVPRSNTDFWEAVPYLKKVSYIGIGNGGDGELATTTLIAGIAK